MTNAKLRENSLLDNFSNMIYCTIGDICSKIYSGGTPSTKKTEFYNGEIPWLNTKEVKFNRIYRTERYISQEGLENSSAKWVPRNSVIVAMYGATAGNVSINEIPLTTNQACCNLVIDPTKADYRYIYYYLKNYNNKLKALANGAAQQNLSVGLIRNFSIKIPKLNYQKKVGSYLSSLDEKIRLNNLINDNLLN